MVIINFSFSFTLKEDFNYLRTESLFQVHIEWHKAAAEDPKAFEPTKITGKNKRL